MGKNARDASPQVPEDTSTTEAEPTAQDATIEQKGVCNTYLRTSS